MKNALDIGLLKKLPLLIAVSSPLMIFQFLFSIEAEAQSQTTKTNHRMEEYRREFGSNDHKLVGRYLNLAKEQKYTKRKEAQRNLFEALRIERLHSGPLHPNQIPIFETLLEIQIEQANWSEAEKNLRILKHLG